MIVQCPKCGRFCVPYLITTGRVYYRCICGYDTRDIVPTWSDRIDAERREE